MKLRVMGCIILTVAASMFGSGLLSKRIVEESQKSLYLRPSISVTYTDKNATELGIKQLRINAEKVMIYKGNVVVFTTAGDTLIIDSETVRINF